MKNIKLSHLLFSLAVIAALVMAAVPAAPAYAMAPEATQTSLTAAHAVSAAIVGVVVCRNKVIWRDGHRVTIRVCKVVHRHNPQ
ncbi:MAG: hypothetical protein CNIPEHKO_02337 [Anaerolineales bacterium]|nr:hypothetical protein [Anaerolineales bacterium]